MLVIITRFVATAHGKGLARSRQIIVALQPNLGRRRAFSSR